MPWHAITRTKKKKKNGKVFAWNGALHVFYENELKKWLFFLFLNLYSLFRIFLIIFSFFFQSNEFSRAIFSFFLFSRSNGNQLYSLTPLLSRGKHLQMKIDRSWKNTQNEHAHTHTHPLLKEFFLHTQIANACNGIKYSTEFDDFVNVPGELFFLSPEKYFEGRLLIKTCYS